MEVSKYNQMMAYLTRPKRGLVDGPGSYSGNPYANSPKFKKFLKEYGDYYRIADVVRAYERKLSTEGKVVGIKKLYEALGPDNPYTFETFNNIFSRADRKITKNMSNVEKNYIKAGQRLKKIIIDNIGEPELLGDLQKKFKGINIRTKGTSTNRVFTLNKTKIKNLNKALNKNYNSIGFREKTIDNVFELVNDKDFMKSLKAYKGGRIDETSPLFKKLFQAGSADMPYAYMTLGRALRGEIAMEGIKKNKALGNKIIKSISGDFEGPLGTAAKRWAKLQMAKHFDDPNASYSSVTQTIKNAFKNAGVKNIDIDEIFPARTGQITIGKGSGAYNQIVQFIDSSINTGAKRAFDGRASKRYQLIIDAYKNKNFDKVKQLVDGHQTDINNFYKRNPEAKGKVKLTQLNYNPKTRKFASPTAIYGKDVLPPKILSDMDKFYRKTGLSLDVGSTMTLEKAAKDESLKKIIAALGCPGKAKGGRIGFQEGTVPSTQCVRAGANIINEGNVKNLSRGQRINVEKFLNGAYKLGRGVAKFGVVPEAIFVAGESLLRIGMGDTFDEAFKRATDYLRTGDQTLEADASKISRTLFDQDAGNLFKSVSNFRKTKKNLEGAQVNLQADLAQNIPEFSGMSDEDIRKIGEDRIKKAKDDFFNAQISKEQQVLSDYQFGQGQDISKAQSFFTAQKLKGKQMGMMEDDPLQIDLSLTPEQKQSPFIDVRSILTQTPESIADEINKAYQAGEYGQTGLEESFEKAKKDYQQTLDIFSNIKDAPLSELAATPVVGIEQIYGANPENFLQKRLPAGASFDPRLAYDFAGGGIAKLAGIDKGPQITSMNPDSGGLAFLKNNVKKL